MKKWFFLPLLFAASFGPAQTLTRLKIEPLDFSSEDGGNFPRSVHQMESEGEQIYIRSRKDGAITIIDRPGRILRTIGRRGEGPGEFRGGIHVMADHRGHLYALAWGKRDRLSHFFEGAFQGDIPLHSRNVSFTGPGSNHFAVLGDLVVFPSHPSSGALPWPTIPMAGKRPWAIGV